MKPRIVLKDGLEKLGLKKGTLIMPNTNECLKTPEGVSISLTELMRLKPDFFGFTESITEKYVREHLSI